MWIDTAVKTAYLTLFSFLRLSNAAAICHFVLGGNLSDSVGFANPPRTNGDKLLHLARALLLGRLSPIATYLFLPLFEEVSSNRRSLTACDEVPSDHILRCSMNPDLSVSVCGDASCTVNECNIPPPVIHLASPKSRE